MSQPTFTLRWGIVGLGQFAAKWTNDVFENYQSDPKYGREITHELNAVVSTSSLTKAESFVNQLNASVIGSKKLYDSYDEFLQDANIDIVYVAAPNAFHYPLALKALKAKKHVLVEKTFAINHKQAVNLKKIAFENGLFILDGLWTRYVPTTEQLQSLILKDGIIGKVRRVNADLSHDCPFAEDSRLHNPGLGGGVLLDNLIYSFNWIDLLLLRRSKVEPTVKSWSLKSEVFPNLDVSTNILVGFDNLQAVGTATGSFNVESPRDNVLIEGSLGYIRVDRASRPSKATLYLNVNTDGLPLDLVSFEGIGYYFEANIAAVSIRDGLWEPKDHPLDVSIRISKIFDLVKSDNGIEFPVSVEEV